jgi:hypothetical protein
LFAELLNVRGGLLDGYGFEDESSSMSRPARKEE